MKNINILKRGWGNACSSYNLIIKSLFISALALTSLQMPLQAQVTQFTKPSWWFGGAVGGNFNFYSGSTQNLNSDFTSPVAFHKGNGIGLYAAPLVEFHRPDSRWGVMFQAGYDNRQGKYKEVTTPCNCPADLSAELSYITVEPSLRFAPFKSNFYLYGGPRLAYNISKSFTYQLKNNPDYPDQLPNNEVNGDLSDINKTLISTQIGAGYDIYLSSQNKHTQFVISPFVSFQPYFGQAPRSIETWEMTTLRAGVALKFGQGKTISKPSTNEQSIQKQFVSNDSTITYTVFAPKNIPVERKVKESFPIRNYVFFDIGSTKIPERYVLLNKEQVKDFKEDNVTLYTPKDMTGRSQRQMTVYYNILNVLGNRMTKNPTTKIRLAGACVEGADIGLVMAENVKQYLVNVFGIDSSRIKTEGRILPRIPSEQPGDTKDLDLLQACDNRVSIWSESPSIMMEFISGPNAPLKPVEINTVQEAPLDSYVSIDIALNETMLPIWKLEVKDLKGNVQNFGPFSQGKVSIPGKSILGTIPEGDYKMTIIGQTKRGITITKDTTVHMVLWNPSIIDEGMRFSVIYEFDNSSAISIYEKYLTDIVLPKIPLNATIIIHGYTDIIGDEAYNLKLSLARANDVKKIMENGLSKAGRNDVKFEIRGFGEDQKLAQFDNKFPEQRFYNRTVIVDIIPNRDISEK